MLLALTRALSRPAGLVLAGGLALAQAGSETEFETRILTSSTLQGLLPLESPEVSVLERGGRTFVAFSGLSQKATRIHWTYRDDGGGEWKTVLPIAAAEVSGTRPTLWLDDGGTLHCAWLSWDNSGATILYSRLDPDTERWMAPRRFPAGVWKTTPRLAGDSHNRLYLYFAVSHGTQVAGEIALHVSEDGGRSWHKSDPNFPRDQRRGRPSSAQLLPDVAGSLFLAWLDSTPGGKALVFNRSTDGGRSWLDEPAAVSGDRRWRYSDVDLLQAGGRVFLVWTKPLLTDRGRRVEVWFDSTPDGGRTWQGNRLLATVKARSLDPFLYAGSGTVSALWAEGGESGPPRLAEASVWPEASDVVTITSAPDGAKFADLAVAGRGELVAATWSSRPRAGLEAVRLMIRGAAGWQEHSMPRPNSEARQLRPLPVFDVSRNGFFLAFHEVRPRRFLLEDPVFGTRLILTGVAADTLHHKP